MTRAGTVLLTGATGGIGSAVATALLDAGYRVLALVRDPSHLGDPDGSGTVDELAGPGAMAEPAGPGGRLARVTGAGLPGAVDSAARPGEPTRAAAGRGGPTDKATRPGEPTDKATRTRESTHEVAGRGGRPDETTRPGGSPHEVAGRGGGGAAGGIAGLGELTPMAANLPWPEMMTAAAPPLGATSHGVTPDAATPAGGAPPAFAPAGATPPGFTPLGVTPASVTPAGAATDGTAPDGAIRAGVIAVVADLARPETLAAALPAIEELDAFVHCAGIAEIAATADSSVDLWRDTFNVNVASAAELLRLLLPALRRRHGRVILINAAPGMSPTGWPAYAASKAALRELADAVRDEERPHGIRVTTIYPGATATELLRKVRTDFGSPYDPDRCLRPSTVASLVLTALTTPPDAHLTELSVHAAG